MFNRHCILVLQAYSKLKLLIKENKTLKTMYKYYMYIYKFYNNLKTFPSKSSSQVAQYVNGFENDTKKIFKMIMKYSHFCSSSEIFCW